ncbi:MAG: hypothetical protein M2R45_00405 [Verrucomicrobia subdivision 3 bacterium]|nr:hypothetical protein [Limisphaerales bacterium]MCS1412836.1 hypothetical protein [Limisphaerales bacterium]
MTPTRRDADGHHRPAVELKLEQYYRAGTVLPSDRLMARNREVPLMNGER